MTMRLQLVRSVTIKPDLIRFSVDALSVDGEESTLVGEYEITLHTNDFSILKTTEDGRMNMEIDLGELQMQISNAVAKANMTAGIAFAIDRLNLAWDIVDDTVPITTDEQEAKATEDSDSK